MRADRGALRAARAALAAAWRPLGGERDGRRRRPRVADRPVLLRRPSRGRPRDAAFVRCAVGADLRRLRGGGATGGRRLRARRALPARAAARARGAVRGLLRRGRRARPRGGTSGDGGQPPQRHPDAPDRGDARRDGRGRGRRRAAGAGPDNGRARATRRGAARARGGRVPAERHDVQRDRAAPAHPPGRRRADPRPHRAPDRGRGRRPGRAFGCDGGGARRYGRDLHAPRSCARRCTSTATATRRARAWSRSSRRPTWGAGGSGRGRGSRRCSASCASTACARTSTARG